MADTDGVIHYSDETFMEEVQKYECLFNTFSKEFRDKYKKINCWTKVAARFGLNPEEAEKRFKNLRSSYTRFLRKIKNMPSGSGRVDLPKHETYKGMEWLRPYIDHRSSKTNLHEAKRQKVTNVDVLAKADSESNTSGANKYTSSGLNSDEEHSKIEETYSIEGMHDLIDESDVHTLHDMISETDNDITISDKTDADFVPKSNKNKASIKRKRAWNEANKAPTKVEMDKVLYNAAKSIDNHLKESKDEHSPAKFNSNNAIGEDDEETLFCRSLIPRLRRIPRLHRGLVRLEIEQIFYQVECSSLQEQQRQSRIGSQSSQSTFHFITHEDKTSQEKNT
jgi:hypothetical protein